MSETSKQLNYSAITQLRFCTIVILFLLAVASGQIRARISPTAANLLFAQCGTVNVKVVFLCSGSMWYVDFSEAPVQIRELNLPATPYFPVISTDGKWITYQTDNKEEGPSSSPKSGKVWFRELAANGTPVKVADTGYVPRFVQNTSPDEPEIMYATSAACPDELCYNAGKTIKKKLVNKSPQPAQVVFEGGSYYGGLSWDNRYLSTGWPGGPNVFLIDLLKADNGPRPVHFMRVKKTATDVDTSVSIGSCNMSRSASRTFTNTILYYDFSSMDLNKNGCYHPLLGTWGLHEKLFISREDGEDLEVFDVPADPALVPSADAAGNGEPVSKAWEDPEWSNHPYYAAAGLVVERTYRINGKWESVGKCESVYLVNLKDSLYVRLVETTDSSSATTTDIAHPFIWVQTPADFQEDATWLSSTIWERAGSIRRPMRPSYRGLISEKAVTAVVHYTITGQRIPAVRISSGKQPEPAGTLSSGVYVAGVRTGEKKWRYFRRVVEK